MTKPSNLNFPETLFVKIEEDGGIHYFIADRDRESIAEQGEVIRVATYRLVSQEKIALKVEIVK